jgi:uncharacterized protein
MTHTESNAHAPARAGSDTPRADPYAYLASQSADVLEQRWFHKFLVLLDAPAHWPAWRYGLVVLLLAVIAAIPWLLASSTLWAAWVAATLAGFLLSDVAIIAALPRWRISFGPAYPQAVILAAPRVITVALAGVIAAWTAPLPPMLVVLAINLFASGALIWGAIKEPLDVGLTRLSLSAHQQNQNAPAIQLLHISDLHIERLGRREGRLLQLVREIAPDIIVLTGDYVNLSCVDDPVAHAHVRQLLGQLGAPYGVFAVLGSPPVDRNSAPDFAGLPIRLLRDEMAVVDVGAGRQIALMGLDCSHDQAADARLLHDLLDRAPAGAYRLLLYHSPDLMPAASQAGVDLYLCGHTHGGQIRLPGYGALITSSRLGKQFEMGYYQMNHTHLYVSRGVGLEGLGAPRIRFLCPPEVALFTLNAAGQVSDPHRKVKTAALPSGGECDILTGNVRECG